MTVDGISPVVVMAAETVLFEDVLDEGLVFVVEDAIEDAIEDAGDDAGEQS